MIRCKNWWISCCVVALCSIEEREMWRLVLAVVLRRCCSIKSSSEWWVFLLEAFGLTREVSQCQIFWVISLYGKSKVINLLCEQMDTIRLFVNTGLGGLEFRHYSINLCKWTFLTVRIFLAVLCVVSYLLIDICVLVSGGWMISSHVWNVVSLWIFITSSRRMDSNFRCLLFIGILYLFLEVSLFVRWIVLLSWISSIYLLDVCIVVLIDFLFIDLYFHVVFGRYWSCVNVG